MCVCVYSRAVITQNNSIPSKWTINWLYLYFFLYQSIVHTMYGKRRWINSFIYDFMMHMFQALSMNWIEKLCSGFESFHSEFNTRESKPKYENICLSRSFMCNASFSFFYFDIIIVQNSNIYKNEYEKNTPTKLFVPFSRYEVKEKEFFAEKMCRIHMNST